MYDGTNRIIGMCDSYVEEKLILTYEGCPDYEDFCAGYFYKS